MPTSYTNQEETTLNRPTFEVDPSLGLVCTGMLVVDGLIQNTSWKSARCAGEGYGYAQSDFAESPDYFEQVSSGYFGA